MLNHESSNCTADLLYLLTILHMRTCYDPLWVLIVSCILQHLHFPFGGLMNLFYSILPITLSRMAGYPILFLSSMFPNKNLPPVCLNQSFQKRKQQISSFVGGKKKVGIFQISTEPVWAGTACKVAPGLFSAKAETYFTWTTCSRKLCRRQIVSHSQRPELKSHPRSFHSPSLIGNSFPISNKGGPYV